MSLTPRTAGWAALLLSVTIALAGCGSPAVIDHKKAEAAFRKLVASYHDKQPTLVQCPAGIAAKKGATFECTVTIANGSRATVTEHILNDSGSLAVGLEDLHVPHAPKSGGLALGTAVRFRNIRQLPPAVSLALLPGRPIDPGSAQNGATEGAFPAAQLWPATSPGSNSQLVQARFINLPVTVHNFGNTPVRIKIQAGATDSQGRETNTVDLTWPGRHGREPDWTSRQNQSIAPGATVTRYLTFAIERNERVAQFSMSPLVLNHGQTLLQPEIVTFRGP
jgi:Domain of unknown function (DUF4333)